MKTLILALVLGLSFSTVALADNSESQSVEDCAALAEYDRGSGKKDDGKKSTTSTKESTSSSK
jgi:hypothetical protein